MWKLYRSQAQNGSIWPAPDLLRLLGPVQKSKVVTMSTFLLHGTLHGGLGRLCQTPSQMSRMPSRASDSIQWNPGLPHKLHFNGISWTSCRNHRYSMPYLLDVLWSQPIKLILVVSTSEFHEYWWNDIDFIFFCPLHFVQGLRSLEHQLL